VSCENRYAYLSDLHLFLFPTLQGILCYALESFLNINAFLGRGFKVRDIPFRGTPCPCLFLWNLEFTRSGCLSTQKGIDKGGSVVWHIQDTYHSAISTIHVDLVSKNNKWEILWVWRACLQIFSQIIIADQLQNKIIDFDRYAFLQDWK